MKDNDLNGNMPKVGRLVFGIFMVIVYMAAGLFFIFDDVIIGNATVSKAFGSLLCLYGLWRGYRLYKGWN